MGKQIIIFSMLALVLISFAYAGIDTSTSFVEGASYYMPGNGSLTYQKMLHVNYDLDSYPYNFTLEIRPTLQKMYNSSTYGEEVNSSFHDYIGLPNSNASLSSEWFMTGNSSLRTYSTMTNLRIENLTNKTTIMTAWINFTKDLDIVSRWFGPSNVSGDGICNIGSRSAASKSLMVGIGDIVDAELGYILKANDAIQIKIIKQGMDCIYYTRNSTSQNWFYLGTNTTPSAFAIQQIRIWNEGAPTGDEVVFFNDVIGYEAASNLSIDIAGLKAYSNISILDKDINLTLNTTPAYLALQDRCSRKVEAGSICCLRCTTGFPPSCEYYFALSSNCPPTPPPMGVNYYIEPDDSNCFPNVTKTGEICKMDFVIRSFGANYTLYPTFVYGNHLDNCSSNLGIPSNATALNFTFLDSDSGNQVNVNMTIDIAGEANYSNVRKETNNYQVCIYPAWANLSETISLSYSKGPIYSYFTEARYLSNITYNKNLFVESGAGTTIFTATDRGTSYALENVLVTMYKQINGTYQVVQAKTTDVSGKVQFSYTPNTKYKFFFSKTGYDDYIFYLDPILYASYSIPMTATIASNVSIDFKDVGIYYYPQIFYDNKTNNLTFMIQNPYSTLVSYNYTIVGPSVSVSNSGVQARGEILFNQFTIDGSQIGDTIVFNYCFQTTTFDMRCFRNNFYIIVTPANYTIANLRNQTYGLGILERVLIATMLVILVVGLCHLIGQTTMGLALGLGVYGYMSFIGFLPIWSILVTMLLGFLFLALKPEY